MKPILVAILSLCLLPSARAELPVGADAPTFTAKAALGGEVFDFSLNEALKSGPVVLYFYPAAFTPGCSVEAHNFAEATASYAALGASVIGVSTDNIDTLKKFSISHCQSKFPVASDADQTISKAYDAVMMGKYSSRTSYVIAPNGKVLYTYSNLSPDKHVPNTLDAVRKWHETGTHTTEK